MRSKFPGAMETSVRNWKQVLAFPKQQVIHLDKNRAEKFYRIIIADGLVADKSAFEEPQSLTIYHKFGSSHMVQLQLL